MVSVVVTVATDGVATLWPELQQACFTIWERKFARLRTTAELIEELGDNRFLFTKGEPILAGEGEAGHLIPPVDHHTIENKSAADLAITIHVYGGVMEEASIFMPQEDGSYIREVRKLPLLVEQPVI